MIVTNYTKQNCINSVDTLGIMGDKCLVDSMNNVNSNRKSFLVYPINDKSDGNGNKKREDISKDPRFKKPNHR